MHSWLQAPHEPPCWGKGAGQGQGGHIKLSYPGWTRVQWHSQFFKLCVLGTVPVVSMCVRGRRDGAEP